MKGAPHAPILPSSTVAGGWCSMRNMGGGCSPHPWPPPRPRRPHVANPKVLWQSHVAKWKGQARHAAKTRGKTRHATRHAACHTHFPSFCRGPRPLSSDLPHDAPAPILRNVVPFHSAAFTPAPFCFTLHQTARYSRQNCRCGRAELELVCNGAPAECRREHLLRARTARYRCMWNKLRADAHLGIRYRL